MARGPAFSTALGSLGDELVCKLFKTGLKIKTCLNKILLRAHFVVNNMSLELYKQKFAALRKQNRSKNRIPGLARKVHLCKKKTKQWHAIKNYSANFLSGIILAEDFWNMGIVCSVLPPWRVHIFPMMGFDEGLCWYPPEISSLRFRPLQTAIHHSNCQCWRNTQIQLCFVALSKIMKTNLVRELNAETKEDFKR